MKASFDIYKNQISTLISRELDLIKEKDENLIFVFFGGNGFLGKEIIKNLSASFIEKKIIFEIYVYSKDSIYKLNIHQNKYQLKEISNLPASITHIIHLATPSKDDSFLINFKSTLSRYMQMMNFFEELCFLNKPKIYYMSSGSSLARDMYSPIKKEFKILLREDPYTALKQNDEERITLINKVLECPTTISNLYTVLMPNQLVRPHFAISEFIKSAIKGKTINIKNPLTLRSFIGIDEILLSIILFLSSENRFQQYSLGSPLPISMIDVGNIVIDFYGKGSISVNKDSWMNTPTSYYPSIDNLHPIMRKLLRPDSKRKINGLLEQVRIE